VKIILSYLLLSSFVVLLTPRDIWHDCDHDHEYDHSERTAFFSTDENHSASDAPQSIEDDCFACDFDLGFFTHNQPQFLTLLERCHCENAVRILSRFKEDPNYSFSLRGPPVTV
jgi:hypothetical protein